MSTEVDVPIAVVIPSYKVKDHILEVIERVPEFVKTIYCVDDCCPLGSGKFIEENATDQRLVVLYNPVNRGVGGAMKTGYARAFGDGHDIAVKIDGDGQMDPVLLEYFVAPIANGLADYTKGNRFYDPRTVSAMPKSRLIGNAGLSFLTKLSSGYYSLFDPTNGYTAIHQICYERLDMDLIDDRFFFETDMMTRLNIIRAVILDVPMDAIYEHEISNLNASKEFWSFLGKNIRAFFKRIVYTYFVRGFSMASVNLILGAIFTIIGIILGASIWIHSLVSGSPTTPGGAALIVVLLVLGQQLMISFMAFDFANEPSTPLSRLLRHGRLSFFESRKSKQH